MGRILDSLRHPYSRILGGVVLSFQLHEDMVIAVDQGGYIPLKADFEDLVEYWRRFYDRHSDEEIRQLVEESKARQARQSRSISDAVSAKVQEQRAGYVYILEGGGYYKIGKTADLKSRFMQISPKLPFEVDLLHTITSDDCEWAEKTLHEKFASKRTNGEWFDLDAGDLAWLTGLKRMNHHARLGEET